MSFSTVTLAHIGHFSNCRRSCAILCRHKPKILTTGYECVIMAPTSGWLEPHPAGRRDGNQEIAVECLLDLL